MTKGIAGRRMRPRANPPPDVYRAPGLPMPPKTLVGKPPVPPVELGSFGAGAFANLLSERHFQGNKAGFHALRWVRFAQARCCGAMRFSENMRAQECLMTEHVTCSGKARLVRQRGLDVIACVWVAQVLLDLGARLALGLYSPKITGNRVPISKGDGPPDPQPALSC